MLSLLISTRTFWARRCGREGLEAREGAACKQEAGVSLSCYGACGFVAAPHSRRQARGGQCNVEAASDGAHTCKGGQAVGAGGDHAAREEQRHRRDAREIDVGVHAHARDLHFPQCEGAEVDVDLLEAIPRADRPDVAVKQALLGVLGREGLGLGT